MVVEDFDEDPYNTNHSNFFLNKPLFLFLSNLSFTLFYPLFYSLTPLPLLRPSSLQQFKKGQRVVVLFPDSIRNYMTKHLNPDWMVEHGFMEEEKAQPGSDNYWLKDFTVRDLQLTEPVTVQPTVTVTECLKIMSAQGFDQLPVVSDAGEILGMVTLGNLRARIVSGRVKGSDEITKAVYKQVRKVTTTTTLDVLSRIFDRDHYALVCASQHSYGSNDSVSERSVVFGVATPIDLLNFMVEKDPKTSA